MKDNEISQVVNRILQEKLAAKGFKGADVASEADFDGGSIIRVVAHYNGPDLEAEDNANVLHQIRNALIEKGEDRFVILQSDYLDDVRDAEEVEN